MTHKASGCEEQTPVGMDGAEPKNFFEKYSNYPLTNWKKYGKIYTET